MNMQSTDAYSFGYLKPVAALINGAPMRAAGCERRAVGSIDPAAAGKAGKADADMPLDALYAQIQAFSA
jgi:hypothetical protein